MIYNLLLFLLFSHAESSEKEDEEEKGLKLRGAELLFERMQEEAMEQNELRRAPTVKKGPPQSPPPIPYMIPGPYNPLPGRSHLGDYMPVFPFHNQYSGGVDIDPSTTRHLGGDLNIAVPSWGIMDIYGRIDTRFPDTTTKIGYMNHPVNMLDLEPKDLIELMTDPSATWNREHQPLIPLGKVAKNFVPINCRPPLCNPYQATFALGIEHDLGGTDGVDGDIDIPVPVSKGIAYRLPISGKLYYDLDNITVTYGQNLAPVDPFNYDYMFGYQKNRPQGLAIPRDSNAGNRRKRSIEDGPRRTWDLDGVDSNEENEENEKRTGDWKNGLEQKKPQWKTFYVENEQLFTMSRREFMEEMMRKKGTRRQMMRMDYIKQNYVNMRRQEIMRRQKEMIQNYYMKQQYLAEQLNMRRLYENYITSRRISLIPIQYDQRLHSGSQNAFPYYLY